MLVNEQPSWINRVEKLSFKQINRQGIAAKTQFLHTDDFGSRIAKERLKNKLPLLK